jgi:hypothetical protein
MFAQNQNIKMQHNLNVFRGKKVKHIYDIGMCMRNKKYKMNVTPETRRAY